MLFLFPILFRACFSQKNYSRALMSLAVFRKLYRFLILRRTQLLKIILGFCQSLLESRSGQSGAWVFRGLFLSMNLKRISLQYSASSIFLAGVHIWIKTLTRVSAPLEKSYGFIRQIIC